MRITDGTELIDPFAYARSGYPHELWARLRRESPLHWCEPPVLVPFWAVNLMALVMPWAELVSGILMVLGVRTKSAAVAIGGMLVMFSLAIVITLLRGIPIGCGCFTSVEEPLGWGTLGRDLVWLIMTLQVYFFPSALQLEGRLLESLQEVDG